MWYLQYLLLFREEIKSTGNIESDEFNDLLVVEMKIKELFQKGQITKEELDIMYYYSEVKVLDRNLRNRKTISKKFNDLCKKLSIILGGVFTDEGYVEYLKVKYSLSKQCTESLRSLLTSTHNNRITERINDRYSMQS